LIELWRKENATLMLVRLGICLLVIAALFASHAFEQAVILMAEAKAAAPHHLSTGMELGEI
jgi:hypothetical protein